MTRVTPIPCCRLCGSARLETVFALRPTPTGDSYLPAERHPEQLPSYPLDLNLCADCGHAQLGDLVDPAEIYANYLYTTSVSLGLADHFARYAETVCRKLELPAGALVVDLGSNDGTLLRAFKARGMKVLGVDPARDIARRATESGIPTINAFFSPAIAEEIIRTHGHATLVIANNVVANVADPSDFVAGVNRLLAPHGTFVWETGYVRYLTEDCVIDNIHHEHIDYYAVRPLVGFYARFGLELFDVEVSTSKGSSIRSYVGRKEAGRPVSSAVPALIAREENAGYFKPATYAALTARLDAIRRELKRRLAGWRAEGKTVAGYGAAIGSTTMLYHFDLAGELDYLVDDNPVRFGLLSPGLALPVRSSARLLENPRPDYVLILAWRYADPIIARNQAYLQQGGTFVRILPELSLCPASTPATPVAAAH
jgi:SAM-dependent methyltransferase